MLRLALSLLALLLTAPPLIAQPTIKLSEPGVARFGYAVAAHGERVVVGAPDSEAFVYVYAYDGTQWAQEARIPAPSGTDGFGAAVAILGDRIAVGAYPIGLSRSGRAFVYAYDGTAWQQEAELVPSGGSGDGQYGVSVSMSGNRVVVGAGLTPYVTGSSSIGAAYVFSRDGGTWQEEARLAPSGGAPGDGFGFDVSISGERVLVGAPGSAGRGAAYVFDFGNDRWSQTARLFGTGVISGDHFGNSVSLNGRRALVGADEGKTGGNAGGKAYYFTTADDRTWSQRQILTASDRPANFSDRRDDRFGSSVGLSGNEALIGAQNAPDVNHSGAAGRAYRFTLEGETWTEQAIFAPSDETRNARFGQAVAVSNGVGVIGAWGVAPGGRAAYVYGEPEVEPDPVFLTPVMDEIVEPIPPGSDDRYTVRVEAPSGASAVDLYVVASSQSSDGERTLVAEDVPVVDGVGTYAWEVPDLLSPSTFLIAVDADDSSAEVVSERFRVRYRWRLYRTVGTLANPEYELHQLDAHVWAEEQSEAVWWPASYWDRAQYDYDDLTRGYDPRIEPVGSVRYLTEIGRNRGPSVYPSWPAFASAFGTAAYESLEPVPVGIQQFHQPDLRAVEAWRSWTDATRPGDPYHLYNGACFGLSIGAIAAFADPDAFAERFFTSLSADAIGTLPVNDEVRDAVHRLFNYQFGGEEKRQWNRATGVGALGGGGAAAQTPRDVLEFLKRRLESDVRLLDRPLALNGEYDVDGTGTFASGGHSVMPLSLMETDTDGVYNVFVYDPNFSPTNNPAVMVIDSTINRWDYSDGGWAPQDTTGLYLSADAQTVFGDADPAWGGISGTLSRSARTARTDAPVEVSASPSVAISGDAGTLAYADGVLTDGIEGAAALFSLTGRPSAPLAYVLPAGRYAAELTPVSGRTTLRARHDGRQLGFVRTYDQSGQPDRLTLGGDTLRATLGGDGQVRVEALLSDDLGSGRTLDRSVAASHLAGSAGAEVRLAPTADGSGASVASDRATTYMLELAASGPGGVRVFSHANVALAAGATHTVQPDWSALGDGPVAVLVDADGDGTTDETLVLSNEGMPVSADEEASPGIGLVVHPNPVRARATVALELAAPAPTTVAVFDALGRRVALLHEGPLPAGTHALSVPSEGLAPGVYVVRAASADRLLSRTFTVVR